MFYCSCHFLAAQHMPELRFAITQQQSVMGSHWYIMDNWLRH